MSGSNFQNPTSAVVLAAGASTRMGRMKALLPLGGHTVIEQVVKSLRTAGVTGIVVVVGHRGDALRPVLARLGIRVATNAEPRRGMFSSVQTGVRALPADIPAFFLLPADVPLVRPWTLRYLQDGCDLQRHAVVHPCFRGRRGHPPLIAGGLAAPILAAEDPSGGLRTVLQSRSAIDVEVPDRNILFDVDTPDDYRELQRRWRRREVPTAEECEVILTGIHPVADAVRAHSRTVAEVADKLLRALAPCGVMLDRELVRAAALLHDLAKGRRHHAAEARRILESMGYGLTGAVAGAHMNLPERSDAAIDEAAVLYLADKLVKGERRVSLEVRFAAAMERFGDDLRVRRRIRQRQQRARVVLEQIERLTGKPLAAILQSDP